MEELFPKKRKSKLLGLQLAPLIDIFVLIIIFLIKSTAMSGASVTPPPDLKPAKSKSPEGIEPAGQVYITEREVLFAMINERISTHELTMQIEASNGQAMTGTAQVIRQKLRDYLKVMPEQEKQAGVIMNFLADASVDYRTTFLISKFCREAGFESLLFVAQGEK